MTTLTSQAGRAIKAGTGGAFTPASWSHDGGGHYLVGLGTGDTDTLGRLRLVFDSGANYLPTWEDYSVLSAAVYDVLFGTVAPSTYAGGAVASVITAVTLPANPPIGFLATASFAAGATIPRVTLVDTTTDVTNAGAIGLGATAPAGWINTAAFATGTVVPADVRTVVGGTPVPADLNNVGLKPTGLDQVSLSPEPGVPTTFRGLLVWAARRFYRSHKTPTSLVVEGDAGAALTTQAVSDDGQGTESISAPS